MLDLPSVTLLCADCIDAERAIAVLEKCKSLCNFGAVRLLTSLSTDYQHAVKIGSLDSICAYSIFMLKRAYLFVETAHVLVVQHDGWIINPDAWNPAWLGYDYAGPLFIHPHPISAMSVGTGGFSLRSKRLMVFVDQHVPAWDGSEESTTRVQAQLGSFEDGVISMNLRSRLVSAGFKFLSPGEAAKFAQGGQNDLKYYEPKPFGFHGQWNNIDLGTGLVSPPPFV